MASSIKEIADKFLTFTNPIYAYYKVGRKIGEFIVEGVKAADNDQKAQIAAGVPLALFGCGISGVGRVPVRNPGEEETEHEEQEEKAPRAEFGGIDTDRLHKWELHEGSITGEGANKVCKVQLTLTASSYVGSGEDSNICRALRQFKSQQRTSMNTMEAARKRFHEVMKELQKNTDESDGKTCMFEQRSTHGDNYSYHFSNASVCERAWGAARELESTVTKYEDEAVAARRSFRNALSSVKPEKQSPLDKSFTTEDSESPEE